MPDIRLRFGKDMLVLSSPVDAALARQGVDMARDREYLNLMEPEAIEDALKLEVAAGAQCVVTATEDITRARLAHLRMSGDADKLAVAALSVVNSTRPQHVLAEIGPCGLPLDAASKASLTENRDQYVDAARAFEAAGEFDAFFLNGFASVADLKCALMGVAKVSDRPVFASATIAESGQLPDVRAGMAVGAAAKAQPAGNALPDFPFDGYELLDEPSSPLASCFPRSCLPVEEWPSAVEAMLDLGASVVGFETPDPAERAAEYARIAAERSGRPVLAQLFVSGASASELVPLAEAAEYTPGTLPLAAAKLREAGTQFLRATGAATAACTGALAAVAIGLDVIKRDSPLL